LKTQFLIFAHLLEFKFSPALLSGLAAVMKKYKTAKKRQEKKPA
jgi:hypothetical protein